MNKFGLGLASWLLLGVGRILASPSASAGSAAPLWLRDAAISPDGKNIAFTYKGDIYRVPVAGGDAVRLTSSPDYEQMPVWSPDSRTIVFASNRHGNFDLYAISADAPGEWKRLTSHSAQELPEAFSPDGKRVFFSAHIQDPVASAMHPSGRMTELYSVKADGSGDLRRELGTPVSALNFKPDGSGSFLYQDVKSFEDTWRKHHTSSATRDIWAYDAATGRHTQLMDRPGEDLNPVYGEDGYFYFLSERDGDKSINVWRAPLSNPAQASAVTRFKTHPVRFLSRATKDGTLCFTYDGEIYTLAPGSSKPSKVKLSIAADQTPETRRTSSSRGARSGAPSPDGSEVAFIIRGDVFVTSTDYKTTRQVTDTPEAESDPSWGADGSTLFYTSERDGKYNIYKATVKRQNDEPGFAYATLIEETPVFKPDGHERTKPLLSPDGKKLAFILDRNKLAVRDMDSGKVRVLTDGSTNLTRGGRITYTWSPDSRWIAMEVVDRKHDPYSDIAILNVESGEMTNLTQSAYFDANPRWVLDGKALLFESERFGMRNHASWGSESDVMIVFMNQEAYDEFRLSKEDAELAEQIEKLHKKAKKEESDSEASDDKKKKKEEKVGDSSVRVELEGMDRRTMRLTPVSSQLVDEAISSDGKELIYITQAPDGEHYLWTIDLREGDVSRGAKLSGPAGIEFSGDGKKTFLLGSTLSKLDGSKIKPISFAAQQILDPAAEREFMFDNMVREERERFYTADMHGVDWDALTTSYRRFLPHINNNYDYAEMLSELLGELNVSHTGGRYTGADLDPENPTVTSSLGAFYDFAYAGPGVKIDEVIVGGPLFGLDPVVKAGSVITAVNGIGIDAQHTLWDLLDGKRGKRTLLSIKDPADGSTREITVKPISVGAENQLLYDRWVKQRAADVDKWSNGRLGYVHISSMDDDSFRKVYSDLLGKYNDREGVVVDIRWNGGGRLHEDIEVLLSGHKYFTQEIRGTPTCDMPSRRWNKPSIMLMSEACYSNAHGTPWVYKNRGLGKLVGMPVAGTMTSVNWVTMQDPTLIYGIPVVGYRLADGSVLENQQLEPDVKVANAPETIVKGEDSQLRAAVEELLRELPAKK